MEIFVIILLIFGGVTGVALIVFSVTKSFTSNYPLKWSDVRVEKTYIEKDDKIQGASYYVEFHFKNIGTAKFKVSKNQFLKIAEGNKGKLLYKGNKFVKFKKEKIYAVGENFLNE